MKTKENEIEFIENSLLSDGGKYLCITVDAGKALKSWKHSLLSYEWLRPDGAIREPGELPAHEQPKRSAVEEKLKNGQPIERPVLGIGIMENVEIGIGRAEFLTLAARGLTRIPVHIPKSNESDFQAFRADIDS